MSNTIDANGMIQHTRIKAARSPVIERGQQTQIVGIIVHQTGSENAASSLSSYKRANANGAHFLIDLDGTIWQTAAIWQRTYHVGKLKARCLVNKSCTPPYTKQNQSVDRMHNIEKLKAPGTRYPMNEDAIGIELVGGAQLPPMSQIPLRFQNLPKDKLLADYGVYRQPTVAQNQSLSWLVKMLEDTLQIAQSEVFRHPEVSRKNETEAAGANWQLPVTGQ